MHHKKNLTIINIRATVTTTAAVYGIKLKLELGPGYLLHNILRLVRYRTLRILSHYLRDVVEEISLVSQRQDILYDIKLNIDARKPALCRTQTFFDIKPNRLRINHNLDTFQVPSNKISNYVKHENKRKFKNILTGFLCCILFLKLASRTIRRKFSLIIPVLY